MFDRKTLFLIPNLLSLTRIVLIPFVLLFFSCDSLVFAFTMLTFILLTDFFDGYLARKLHQTSDIGAILDPIADKLVVLSFFGFFFYQGVAPLWYVILVFIRDLSQLSVIPVLIFWKKIIFQVKPKQIPKWGTALNFFILALYFLSLTHSRGNLVSWVPALFVLELPLLIVSAIIELYILFTFVPRYYQIFHGTHNTFE